jgi:hypothetical protein
MNDDIDGAAFSTIAPSMISMRSAWSSASRSSKVACAVAGVAMAAV